MAPWKHRVSQAYALWKIKQERQCRSLVVAGADQEGWEQGCRSDTSARRSCSRKQMFTSKSQAFVIVVSSSLDTSSIFADGYDGDPGE